MFRVGFRIWSSGFRAEGLSWLVVSGPNCAVQGLGWRDGVLPWAQRILFKTATTACEGVQALTLALQHGPNR